MMYTNSDLSACTHFCISELQPSPYDRAYHIHVTMETRDAQDTQSI